MARFESMTEKLWRHGNISGLTRPQIAKVLRYFDEHPREVPQRTEAEKLEDLATEQKERGGETTGQGFYKWLEANGVKAGN